MTLVNFCVSLILMIYYVINMELSISDEKICLILNMDKNTFLDDHLNRRRTLPQQENELPMMISIITPAEGLNYRLKSLELIKIK